MALLYSYFCCCLQILSGQELPNAIADTRKYIVRRFVPPRLDICAICGDSEKVDTTQLNV